MAEKKIFSITIKQIPDSDPDTSWIGEYSNKWQENAIDRQEQGDWNRGECRYFIPSSEYPEQDYARMKSLNNRDWYFLGIQAEAQVGVSFDGGKTYKMDNFTSGGLWGIESDSDQAYLREVGNEELQELVDILLAYGFTEEQIAEARQSLS